MTARLDRIVYGLSAAGLLLVAGGLFAAAVPPAPAVPRAPAIAQVARSSVSRNPVFPAAGAARLRPAAAAEPEIPRAELRTPPRAQLPETTAGGPAGEVERFAQSLAGDTAAAHRALARYAVYRPLILETLGKYGLPLDLAFVPWVESGWRNEARSDAGAVGMWQFMAETARDYDLEVSAYVDERRDPIRATEAAARYLSDLFRATHDWHAALASYNAGLGRAGHTSGAFWRRRGSLPAETRKYVPRVLAAAQVGRRPSAWGLRAPVRDPLRFREVTVDGGTALDELARMVGADPGAVRDLNPHLIRGVTPPGRRWPVRVPPSTGKRS